MTKFNENLLVDIDKQCKATILLGIVIAEPLKNGSWRPVHVGNESVDITLEGHNHQELISQIYTKLTELKTLWNESVILTKSLPTDVKEISSKTGKS